MTVAFVRYRQNFQGARLREAREANGICSRRDMARAMGVPRKTIAMLEARSVGPISEEMLARLVLALGVPQAWFFRRVGRSAAPFGIDFMCHIDADGTGYSLLSSRSMHGLSYEELHRTAYGQRTIGKVRR